MQPASVFLVCILLTFSVWTVHGGSFEVNIDDQEQGEVEISVNAGKFSGMCRACKWSLNKLKQAVGLNATAEKLTSKLKSICDKIGLLKYVCRKFVKTHIREIIKELRTTDDVRTICVHTGACEFKEMSNLLFYPSEEESSIDMNEYLWREMDD